MACLVCTGTPGLYPIINSRGQHLYDIKCPECEGTGLTDDEFDLERQKHRDAIRYRMAMDAMRGASK